MFNRNKYPIERRYINKRGNTRPGIILPVPHPAFGVAHDTGNKGAGADAHFRYFQTLVDRDASAQTFIDDVKILEIIPAGTGPDRAEVAWHVRRNVKTDNERFGYDSNYAALGVELCFGGRINNEEAYKRFVWYFAYCADKFGWNVRQHIASHKQLDPTRKIDCENALGQMGRTLKNLIEDIETELRGTPTAPVVVPKPSPAPVVVPAADYRPMPVDVAKMIVDTYVRPAEKAARAATTEGSAALAEHYVRLAANVHAASGPKGVKLFKSNAQEIIFNFLSPAYEKAKAAGNQASADYVHNRANYLRRASGIPV